MEGEGGEEEPACPTLRLSPRWSPMMGPWALLSPCAASTAPATLAAAMGIVDRGGEHPAMLLDGPFAGFPRSSGRCAAPSRSEIAAGIMAYEEDSLT